MLTFFAWAAAGFAGLLLAAWALGRAVTDSWGWSQFLYWIPTPVALLVAGVALGKSYLAARFAGPTPAAPRRRTAARTRIVLCVAWAGVLVYMLAVEFHAGRYFAPVRADKSAPGFRVLFWNAEVDRIEGFEQRVHSQSPDIAVISNAPRSADWQRLRDDVGPAASTVRSGRFTIVSRYPILRWGQTDLRISGVRPRVSTWKGGGNIGFDSGQAMFAQLDTTATIGRITLIWVLDLPSDPTVLRRDMLRHAATSIRIFNGPVFVREPDKLDKPDSTEVDGFPEPDLIVGDFNTPRGSASLAPLTRGYPTAFSQAGRGFAPTWHRKFPIIPIDQCFVGPRLRAAGAAEYHAVDLGAAQHRALVVDVAPAQP
jgi:hypothetical protein